MRFYFLFFLLIILISASLVSAALSLDKGKLEFNVGKGEEMCKIVKVSSEDYVGKVSIRDIWPEEGEEESGFSKYTLTAEDYNINIKHPSEILDFNEQSEIEVCLSGSEVGDFRGALIFTPEPGDDVVNVVVDQLVPALVVIRIFPASPTTYPFWLLTKKIPFRLLVTPLVRRVQLSPPLIVL